MKLILTHCYDDNYLSGEVSIVYLSSLYWTWTDTKITVCGTEMIATHLETVIKGELHLVKDLLKM